jgi:V8-like Glu-specific endopeptidase
VTKLVDRAVFPWTLGAAQQLLDILCELYPDTDSALAMAEDVGIRRHKLRGDQPAYLLWRAILTKSSQQMALRPLVENVLADNPRSVRGGFLRRLLDEEPEDLAIDARPAMNGGSGFIAGDDSVTHPEALLFHDDLSLKIGRLPWLLRALERIGSLAGGVCKIVSSGQAGVQNGTGFLIGPRLVMTNWHVVETDGARALRLCTLFGFDDDGQGGVLSSLAIDGDMEAIKGEAADDWAVFQLVADPPQSAAMIKLSESAEAQKGEAAFVVQHPGGETKRIAYARNTVTEVDERVVHYLSDTMAGSSGSPVFNDEGRVIALHHAGGLPQKIAGRPPLVKNEGVRIQRVIERMRQQGCEVA